MNCDDCSDDIQPERMKKGELMQEVVERADLPEMDNTASYGFKREHFEKLVKFLRSDSGEDLDENVNGSESC